MSSGMQLAISVVLLVLAFWLHQRGARGLTRSRVMLAAAMLSLILYALYLVSDYFTADGINDAVIFHLKYGLSGAGFMEYAGLIMLTLSVLGLASWLLFRLELRRVRSCHRQAGASGHYGIAALFCAACSLGVNPASVPVYGLLSGVVHAEVRATVDGRGDAAMEAEFTRHFEPPLLERTSRRPHNLVFIYAESLERTYFDERLFPGLMPHLSRLEKEATSFTDIRQVSGTGWTIAGMVASQCGIPLFTPSHGNSMAGLDSFLPAANCLGDLLKGEGYHLAFLGGAKKRFAGKGTFYETHHFDEVAGRDELSPGLKDPAYLSAWGLYDDTLFELAFERYADQAKLHGPHALFLLTLDTHHPDGHLSGSCRNLRYRDGKNLMLNAVHCTDRLLAGFIDRIRSSRYGKDAVIVLVSDHLAMKNAAYDLLERSKRRNLFMILSPDTEKGLREDTRGSSLDIAPTIAPFMGYRLRLGLGSDLRGKGRALDARVAAIQESLPAWGESLSRFWGFPNIRGAVEVDVARNTASIDGWPFSIPSLIEVDRGMRTVIKFPGIESSMELVRKTPSDKAFLLVADCSARNPHMQYGQTCLFAGQGGRFHTQLVLREKMSIRAQDIWNLAGGGREH